MQKLGVIVPYRNRYEQLQIFKARISEYLEKKGIPFELIVVEQDDAKLFNRGMLLNIGFKYAKKMGCRYVVFHDVDLIPYDVDYSHSEYPIHLAKNVFESETGKKKESFDQYFGGVTIFPEREFRRINGYSNKYWGWGFEDDDLFLRCEINGCELDTSYLENSKTDYKALTFNGLDSYVVGKNNFDLKSGATIFISFRPGDLSYDFEKESDFFTAFCLPGFGTDTLIAYNSFKRYHFSTYDSEKRPLYLNSEIIEPYQTNICAVFDPVKKKVFIYQDGVLLGETDQYEELFPYENQKSFYLGASNPKRAWSQNFFKGTIDTFAVIQKPMEAKEVSDLCTGLKFSDYKKNNLLKVLYTANYIEEYKMIDLSGNGNDGKIFNCEIKDIKLPKYTQVKIPHRRNSTFHSLKHEENGFFNNKWKDQSTRWNQLRYHNEILKNKSNVSEDGLSDLQFVEHGRSRENNITHVKIGI
jgi:hypothetical protein